MATRRGRPRDPRVETDVLEATLTELTDRGWRGLSVDRIARASGVSKPTIYSRWPDRAQLVIAALVDAVPPLAVDATDNPLADLERLVVDFCVALSTHPAGRAVLALHADSTHVDELVRPLHERYLGPRSTAFDHAVRRARARGDLRAGVRTDDVRDLLFGPLIYGWLITGEPITQASARRRVGLALLSLRHP